MKSFTYAVKQIVPLALSYIFVGLASGILLDKAGYSPIWAFLSGLLIYAGSMQIVMVSLLTSGAPLYMVAAITLFINARHIFTASALSRNSAVLENRVNQFGSTPIWL